MRRTSIGVVAAVVLNGCSWSGEKLASTDAELANLPRLQAAAGKLTLRIVPEAAGAPKYYLGNATQPSRVGALTNELVAARRSRPEETTLYVYSYPGVGAFYVIRAMQAATEAGVRRVEGIADYTDDASVAERMSWKRWSQDLVSIDARSAATDLARADTAVKSAARR